MPVEIRHEQIELPTYVVGDENPNPWFSMRCGAHPYPYRLQDKLTGFRQIRTYDAVVVENQFLRLMVLPDLGCRLWSVYDKLLGREVFHRNDCVRPGLLAIRGAWISGGIEFNFPIGHSVYTHSRIPCIARANSDGSGSVIFGHTEQMSGMRFVVEIRLSPDEYRFSHYTRLYNPTRLPHRYYWWTNAALVVTDETELVYPITRAIGGAYEGEVTWPVHEGVDLSTPRKHPFAVDLFALDAYDEFFGAYHWELGYGVAHWAKWEELPARKAFLWGQDEMGKLWQKMLTENAGDYLEIQAGRFATQSDFDLLKPHELVEFTEYWIPIARTEGFVKANPDGVISIRPGGRVAIQSTRLIEGARVRISADGESVYEGSTNLYPGEVRWIRTNADATSLAVDVLDSTNRPVITYNPADRDTKRRTVPRTPRFPEKVESPDEILTAAQAYERADMLSSAEDYYRKLIGTGYEVEARKGLARLYLLAGKESEAAQEVRFAADRDPEGAAYLALASRGSEALWESLVDDPAYGTLARRCLAEEAVRKGEYQHAVELAAGSHDPVLMLLRVTAARKSGDISRATVHVSEMLEADPLWRHAMWEDHLLGGRVVEVSAEAFQEDMDAAAWYLDLGLREEARTICECWVDSHPPKDPFFDALIGELGCAPPAAYRCDEPGVVVCFAHRDTFLRMLETRDDPESYLHMGNILYSKNRTDEALEKWKIAAEAGYYLAWRNMALAYMDERHDPAAAYQFMKRASDLNPNDADTLRDLDILAEQSGSYDDRVEIGRRILRHASEDSACLERAVRAFLESGYLDEAVELITERTFFVAELAYQTRILYVRALLSRGTRLFEVRRFSDAEHDFRRATEYPPNLGAGRRHGASDAQAFYLLGLALAELGRDTEARSAWETAANDSPFPASEQAYYVGMARKRLGRTDSDGAFDLLGAGSDVPHDRPRAGARRHYLNGLRYLGRGDVEAARRELGLARKVEVADLTRMHRYLENVSYSRHDGRQVPIPVWWTVEPSLKDLEVES